MINRILLPLVLLLLAGCSSPVHLISFKDPAFRTTQFRRILVLADSTNVVWRKLVEAAVVNAITDRGILAMESSEVIPPTRVWGASERRDSMLAAGTDAVLQCSTEDAGADEWYVPSKTTTTLETEKRSKKSGEKGDSVRNEVIAVTTTTSTTGGYTNKAAWAHLSLKLIDLRTGNVAWMSSYRLYDNAGAREQFADQLSETLLADGIVAHH